MATARVHIRPVQTEPPALTPADGPVPVCGECVFHVPHAVRQGGWCACAAAELKWKLVSAGRPVCDDFASWPADSPAGHFLEAMRH